MNESFGSIIYARGASSNLRFDLSKGYMLESGVMKDMGKKDQEEEKWPII